MDDTLLDRIARLRNAAASRRTAIGAVIGAALALAAGEATAKRGAASRRQPKPEGPCGDGSRKDNICTRDKQCCTGFCQRKLKNKDGKGRCRCVRKGSPCKPSQTCCGGITCTEGVCRNPKPCVPQGGACQQASQCCASMMCGGGVCVGGVPTSERCAQGDFCSATAAICTAYAEKIRDGEYTKATYCLLPNGETCSGDNDCASANCASGTCAAVVCDVCASGCAYDNLDLALVAAADGAVIRVDAGTWTITNGDNGTPGGGQIKDGRHLTVRACNGVSGVDVTTTTWSVLYIERPDFGGWTLEGLHIYGNAAKTGPWIYVAGKSAAETTTLTLRDCAVDNHANATFTAFIEAYEYTAVTATDTTFTKGAGSTGPTTYGIYVNGLSGKTQPSVLTLDRVTIRDAGGDNLSVGGLDLHYCTARLTDCTISNNTGVKETAGGGISIDTFDGPVNLTLAGTTTVTSNTATKAKGVGGISARTKVGGDIAITIAAGASVTGNTGPQVGGVGHWYQSDDTHGVLTLTGGDRIFGNTGTDQCANIPQTGSTVLVPGCVWP